MNVQAILDVLSSSDIVQKITVIVLVQEPGRQALRATALQKEDTFSISTRHRTEASDAILIMFKKEKK